MSHPASNPAAPRARALLRARLALGLALAAASGWAGEAPPLRLVHLTDTHCSTARTNPPPRYLLDPMAKNLVASFDLLEAAVRDINEQVKPDLVVVTGDLIDRPDDAASLRRAKRILDGLSCPYYATVGNHDGHAAWKAVFGARWVNYTFSRGGWRFVVVDTSRGRVDAATLDWLRRVLDADTTTPTVVATHVPLVVPEAHMAAARAVYGAGVLLRNAQEVLGVLSGRGNVRAVLAGHVHAPIAVQVGGIHHLAAPALVTLGHHYAIVEAKGDEITTTYRAVSLSPAPAAGDERW